MVGYTKMSFHPLEQYGPTLGAVETYKNRIIVNALALSLSP